MFLSVISSRGSSVSLMTSCLYRLQLPYVMNELTLTELDMGFSIPKILHASAPSVDHQGRKRSSRRCAMFFTQCSGWSAAIEIYYFPVISLLPVPLLSFIVTQAVYQFAFLPFWHNSKTYPRFSLPHNLSISFISLSYRSSIFPKLCSSSLWIKTFPLPFNSFSSGVQPLCSPRSIKPAQ